jgi:hypothetical protein
MRLYVEKGRQKYLKIKFANSEKVSTFAIPKQGEKIGNGFENNVKKVKSNS